MKLTPADRAALSEAILHHVNGSLDIERSCPHAERFGEWARRVREGAEVEGDVFALAYLNSLPYTHPPIDDDNTPEDDARAAAFFLAIAKANGGDYPARDNASRTADVLALILRRLP